MLQCKISAVQQHHRFPGLCFNRRWPLSMLCINGLQEQKTRLMQQDEERTAKRRAKRQKQKVLFCPAAVS